MARKYGIEQKDYSTTQAAEVATAIKGVTIGRHWIRTLWLEALGMNDGIGKGVKLQVPARFVEWMIDYSVMRYTYGYADRMNFRDYLIKREKRLPVLKRRKASKSIAKRNAGAAVPTRPDSGLVEYMQTLEERITLLEKGRAAPKRQPKKLDSKVIPIGPPRLQIGIRKDFNAFIQDRGYDFRKSWGFLNGWFAKQVGGYDADAYAEHNATSYLAYLASVGLLPELRSCLQQVMDEMDAMPGKYFPSDDQKELDFDATPIGD